jgi:hypothetical protein
MCPPVAVVGHDLLEGMAVWCPAIRRSFEPDQPGFIERG